jgi:hypothetical protein
LTTKLVTPRTQLAVEFAKSDKIFAIASHAKLPPPFKINPLFIN